MIKFNNQSEQKKKKNQKFEREIKFFVRKNYACNGRENVKFILKG